MMSPLDVIGGIDRAVADPNRAPEPFRLLDLAVVWSTVAVLIGALSLGPFLVALGGDALLDSAWNDDQSSAFRLVGVLGMAISALPHNKFAGLYSVPLLAAVWALQTHHEGYSQALLRVLGLVLIALQFSLFVW